ncbi:MAG: hypothetical protein Q8914_02490 [Bacteroidota bacterium]|nr:hypothetical protein [Bacteroidota bacterium]
MPCQAANRTPIDRRALVSRHTVRINRFDSLASLSVGNGNFAFTVDATGLQSFPNVYTNGVPLGTQAQWGWHSFPNSTNLKPEETWGIYTYHGKQEPYAVQFDEPGRNKDASDYFRGNPHRLHLGIIGLDLLKSDGTPCVPSDISNIQESLNLWKGLISSTFKAGEFQVDVTTCCLPDQDKISSRITSSMFRTGQLAVKFQFPYPSGKHTDDACDWQHPDSHQTIVLKQDKNSVLLERKIDNDHYYIKVTWEGDATFFKKGEHDFRLKPANGGTLAFSCLFLPENPLVSSKTDETTEASFDADLSRTTSWWNQFWTRGGAVDFSGCTDPRASELERRVVLSQYLMAIQCAGMYPPQETGLTYNSWFGKFHLEMHWWHAAQFALWQRPDLLERSLNWYKSAMPAARSIAARQGWKGVRWMKMTDPSGIEAPSNVGSFLIWQQPHLIYMAELMYRDHPDTAILNNYKDLVFQTADFMADYVDYDQAGNRYILKGAIPAQETLKASETVNPPLELSYWHFALSVAQQWRLRLGMPKNEEWETIIEKLAPLAQKDGLYLAAETATDTYTNVRYTSDHMAVLGALGMLPASPLVRKEIMTNTLNWILKNWNWDKTWGWDYPMTAMCAARLGQPEKAVDALLMDRRTNTYLVNGHNYQDGRLRIYLPGNGGLLSAVAMMCAGWDGSKGDCPGFPRNGKWKVRWENLDRMP